MTISNKSGLKPLGRAILVKAYEPERAAGMIHIPETVRDKTLMVEQRAVVIAVGAAAWEDEKVPRAVPGDKVLVSKFAGYMAKGTGDGEWYRLVNDRDIFAAIVEET